MTAYVTTASGQTIQLPTAVAWSLNYTAGVPCDSFCIECLWDEGETASPADWVRFFAMEEGTTVFRGVVDECEVTMDGRGYHMELSGRGMAALLLDNEALGQDYGVATLEDILHNHVTPYGIAVAEKASFPAVSQFSVASGSSEWSVLYEFCRYHGGVTPRFSPTGALVLTGWGDTPIRIIDMQTTVVGVTVRDRRYGVQSEVLVRDRYRNRLERVTNGAFLSNGGCSRRVITMPGKSNYKAMRYSGRYQLEKSAVEQLRIEVTVAALFFAQPGDRVEIVPGWGRNGRYRVLEAQVTLDSSGGRTVLELAPLDVEI